MRSALVIASALALAMSSGCVGSHRGAPASTLAPTASMGEEHEHHHDHNDGEHRHTPELKNVSGDVLLSAASPVKTVNVGGSYAYLFAPDANTSGYVFELTWTATTPLSEKLSMIVRPHGDDLDPDYAVLNTPAALARAEGPSALRIALDALAFKVDEKYDVVVRADDAPVGVTAEQPFVLHISTFQMLPFDRDWTMLA